MSVDQGPFGAPICSEFWDRPRSKWETVYRGHAVPFNNGLAMSCVMPRPRHHLLFSPMIFTSFRDMKTPPAILTNLHLSHYSCRLRSRNRDFLSSVPACLPGFGLFRIHVSRVPGSHVPDLGSARWWGDRRLSDPRAARAARAARAPELPCR